MSVHPDPSEVYRTRDRHEEQNTDGEIERRSFFTRWGWPLFGLAALVIFELTASLMWSALVFALRFGWRDVYAGWFFWRRDKVLSRGAAIALLHLSVATVSVCFIGLVVDLVIGFVSFQFGQGNAPQVENALRAMTALFLGGVIAAVLFFVSAVLICLSSGRRVWIDRQSYLQAIHRNWPPSPSFFLNRCHEICFFAMIPITVLYVMITFMLPLLWLPKLGNMWALAPLVIGPLTVWKFFVICREWTSRAVTASTPHECWPEMFESHSTDVVAE